MSKAAELAALIGSQTALSNRNLIINGAMQVAQRGTSQTGVTANGYHTLDRWRLSASGATFNTSQQEFTLGQTSVPSQFKYYQRFEVTTGADFAGVLTRIEGVDVVSDEKVTLSFYAKGTNPGGGSVRVSLRQIFGSGGSDAVDVTDQSITLTSSWQRFELTYDVPSLSGKTIGTSSYLQVKLGQGSDTSTDAWTIDLTGVQLEVGEQATPFEHRSFGDELARCQRYFCKSFDTDVTPGTANGNGAIRGVRGDGSFITNLFFPQEMRAAPTVTMYSPTTGASGKVRNLSGAGSDETSAAFSQGTRNAGFTFTSTSTEVCINAHFTAEAEL